MYNEIIIKRTNSRMKRWDWEIEQAKCEVISNILYISWI